MKTLAIRDIAAKIAPVAEKYALRYVWLFGSRARGDARPDSDVDLLTTTEGSRIKSLIDLRGLYMDLKDVLGIEPDIATLEGIRQSLSSRRFSSTAQAFQAEVEKEKVLINSQRIARIKRHGQKSQGCAISSYTVMMTLTTALLIVL